MAIGAQGLGVDDLKVIPRGNHLKKNLGKLALGKMSPGERMSALGDPTGMPYPQDPVPMGRGVWAPAMVETPTLIQTYFDPKGTDNMRGELDKRLEIVTNKTDYSAYLPADAKR